MKKSALQERQEIELETRKVRHIADSMLVDAKHRQDRTIVAAKQQFEDECTRINRTLEAALAALEAKWISRKAKPLPKPTKR